MELFISTNKITIFCLFRPILCIFLEGSGNTAVHLRVCVTLRESWNHVFHCRKFDKLVDTSPLFFPAIEKLERHCLVSSFSVNNEIGNYPGVEVFSISVNIKIHPQHGNPAGNKLTAVWWSSSFPLRKIDWRISSLFSPLTESHVGF